MRLYNPSSCTPIASNLAAKKWAPPTNFVPVSPTRTPVREPASRTSENKCTSPQSKNPQVVWNSTDLTATTDSYSDHELIRRFSSECFRFDIDQVQACGNECDREDQELVECLTYASSSTLSSWSNTREDRDPPPNLTVVDTTTLRVAADPYHSGEENSVLWNAGKRFNLGESNLSPCVVSRYKLSASSMSVLFPSGAESVAKDSPSPIPEGAHPDKRDRILLFPTKLAGIRGDDRTATSDINKRKAFLNRSDMQDILDDCSWTTFHLPFTPIDVPSSPPVQSSVTASPLAKWASMAICQSLLSPSELKILSDTKEVAHNLDSPGFDDDGSMHSDQTPLLHGHVHEETYMSQNREQNRTELLREAPLQTFLHEARETGNSTLRKTSQNRTLLNARAVDNISYGDAGASCWCEGALLGDTLWGMVEDDSQALQVVNEIIDGVRFYRYVSSKNGLNLTSPTHATIPRVASFDTEALKIGFALAAVRVAQNEIAHAVSTMDDKFISTELVDAVISVVDSTSEDSLHHYSGRSGVFERNERLLSRLHHVDAQRERLHVLRELCRISDSVEKLSKDLLLLTRKLEEIRNSKPLRSVVGILLHLHNLLDDNKKQSHLPSSSVVSRLRECLRLDHSAASNYCDSFQGSFLAMCRMHPLLSGLTRDLPKDVDDVITISWTECGERIESIDTAVQRLRNDASIHGLCFDSSERGERREMYQLHDDEALGRGFVRLSHKMTRLHEEYNGAYEQIQRILYYFGETAPTEDAITSIFEIVHRICSLLG